MDAWTEEVPESGVSRGPFELMLFVQMNCEAVASGETLITYMALVASRKPSLVSHGRPMKNINWHVWEEKRQRLYFLPLFTSCSRLWWSFMVLRAREVKLQPVMSQWKVGSLLWVSRCLRKSIKFLHLGGKQRNGWNGQWSASCLCRCGFWAAEDLAPVFATVAGVRLLVTVPEFDMISQRRWWGTGHVAEWAFVVAHCKKTNSDAIQLPI